MRSNLALQCSEHPLVAPDQFESLVDFGIFLMHKRDYQEAARLLQGQTLRSSPLPAARFMRSTCRLRQSRTP
jgi:hypothetical protein